MTGYEGLKERGIVVMACWRRALGLKVGFEGLKGHGIIIIVVTIFIVTITVVVVVSW
jgi:hypothetical protein